jgi:hypothetical protein
VIKQAPVKGRNAVKVSFVLPQDAIPGKTSRPSVRLGQDGVLLRWSA